MYQNCGVPVAPSSKMALPGHSRDCKNETPQQPKSILKSARVSDSTDEALIDALRQSQAANCALEAAVNMQAADMQRLAAEMEVLRQENKDLRLRLRTNAILEVSNKALDGASAVLAEKAELAAWMSPPDQPPPGYYEGEGANWEESVQASPALVDAEVQTESEKGKAACRRSNRSSVDSTSAHVAEAFRLGWLAGAGAKNGTSAQGSGSTRSEVPSDDGLSISHSDGHSTGGHSVAATPPSSATPRSILPDPDMDLIVH